MNVNFKKLDPNAIIPTKSTTGSGAYDVYSTCAASIEPSCRMEIPTGLALEIPKGYVALVCPRSGKAKDYGLTVINAPGVIDSDYRGEAKVLMINHDGYFDISIEVGDKIAQLLFVKAEDVEFTEVEELSSTARGTGGFGSTGK